MGVPVDDDLRVRMARQGSLNALLGYIGDGIVFRLLFALAAGGAQLGGNVFARAKRQRQQDFLHNFVAHDFAVAQIAHIVGAHFIAVGEQNGFAKIFNHLVFGQQRHVALGGVAFAQQKIAVAGDKVHGRIGGEGGKLLRHLGGSGAVVIIACPCVKQIAQDVERGGFALPIAQKLGKQGVEAGGVVGEVQIGDKQDGHGGHGFRLPLGGC